jgi:hypothetical protein
MSQAHHDTIGTKLVTFVNWLAALLGIGTFVGLVNVVVGVLSACWIALQLWGYWHYELPLKRAKLKAALAQAERLS